MPFKESSAKLRDLIHRKDKVLTVLHPGSYSMARTMEQAGGEAGFCGTGGEFGMLTGMEDDGTASIPECVMLGGWVARGVAMPVMLDGDTGHGGVMAVRRLVRECIAAGLSGVRIDDQEIEGKRATGAGGLTVAPIDTVVARYRAAVDVKNELDPNFVVMAQCYAGEAANGGFEDAIRRLQAYEEAGADWVQFVSPKSMEEISAARKVVSGPFSVIATFLKQEPSDRDLLDMGVTIRWGTPADHFVQYAAMYDYVADYLKRGPEATNDWRRANAKNPIANGEFKLRGGGRRKQEEFERKYLAGAGKKYEATEAYTRVTGPVRLYNE